MEKVALWRHGRGSAADGGICARGWDHTGPLMTPDLNYAQVGATRPGEQTWREEVSGYRRYERTVRIGRGSAQREIVTSQVLAWEVKARSGFTVKSVTSESVRVQLGTDYVLTAAFGPFSLREPVRVVATVDQVDRCGFAYGTLEGHPG
jgi:uncharacterized protein (UPF0548 family)